MTKAVFKEYRQGQISLFPARLDDKIPEDAPVRLVNQVVDNLDITSLIDSYDGGGCSSYHPRMMLKIVLFAYLSNVYSCRKIEERLRDSISFMWLSGDQVPDHNTINRFRSSHLKENIHQIFTQVALLLVEMGHLSLNVVYVDGTKIESRANRYTFVWRKNVERNKAKLEEKIKQVLKQIEEGIAQDNRPEDEPPTPINSQELKRRIAEINRENCSKEKKKALNTLEKKQIPKLQEYEEHLRTLGDRGSYSKTDKDATFMRMKDDHLMTGQLKPGFNLQIATENQFITHYDFYSNPADTVTFIPFLEGFQYRYSKMPKKAVADAGYGSEENYEFMEKADIDPFVKFNYFHIEQKKSFKNDIFRSQNLYYNKEEDYFVCPMGQHMERKEAATRKTANGFITNIIIYEAANCTNCPLKSLCYKTQGNRKIEINNNLCRHKEKVRKILTSEEGLYHRRQRSIEPEAVFGQTKANKQYNRFRHFGKDNVKMDFAIFAIAFNIGKLAGKTKNKRNNLQKLTILTKYITTIVPFLLLPKLFIPQIIIHTDKTKLAA